MQVKTKIIAILEKNELINADEKQRLLDSEEFVDQLTEIFKEQAPQLIDWGMQQGLYSQEDVDRELYWIIPPQIEEESIQEEDQTVSEEIEQIDNIPEEIIEDPITVDETESEIDVSEIKEDIIQETPEVEIPQDHIFTKSEIEEMIARGDNLYKKLPGNRIEMKDDHFYAKVQLYRFIDAKASDFILETQKKWGLIQHKIIFKIDWENETQATSQWVRIEDKSMQSDVYDFECVKKYIVSSLWNLNSDLKHVMQDGSFSLEYRNTMRDFRMNGMPARTYWVPNPRYVIRLATEGDNCNFESIELLDFAKQKYKKIINNKLAWMVLFTWPTGSWKTTTIYSILNEVDKEKNGILSVESPIESQVYWVNQTEITERWNNEKYTNMEALKWILRQALDLVFVWEMRSAEEIVEGVNTALVWNKIISTMHTNSWSDTILRLLSEWVNPNAIGNGVKYITAQRLVSKLCPHCKVKDEKSKEYSKIIERKFKRANTFFLKKLKDTLVLAEEDFSISNLENLFKKHLSFAYKDDIETLLEAIEKNEKKIDKKTSWDEKIAFILELGKTYPYPEVRAQEIESRLNKFQAYKANPSGCDHCRGGYSGRVMVVEIMEMDKWLKSHIHKELKLHDLESFLDQRWHLTMIDYGYLLLADGLISMEKLKESVEE